MGIEENRTLLQKADLALADLTSDGGILVAAQAANFIRLLIKESVMMKLATVVPMKAQKQLIEKIKFGSRVLRPGSEATPLAAGDRVKPDLSKVELDAQLFRAEVRLDDEVLEDNIERQTLKQTVMEMLGEAIARDMDEAILLSDTHSADAFLAKFDGLLHEATSHTHDALDTTLTKTILKAMVKLFPSQYLRNFNSLRFLTSVNAEIDYRDSLADRGTVLGDSALKEQLPVSYSGIPVIRVPMFPETVGTGSHCTNVLLTDPKNANVGIWRQIKIETDRIIQEGVMVIVASLRFDVKWAEKDAVVKASNVKAA